MNPSPDREKLSALVLVLALVALPATAGAQEAPATDEEAADEEFLNQPTDAEEPAEADAAAAEGADEGEDGERKRDHKMQGEVSVLFGTGWYMVAPYKDNKNDPATACGPVKTDSNGEPEGEPVCSGLSPLHLDFLGGFGFTDGMEVFLMFRLGLHSLNEYVEPQRLIGAGIKAYSPRDGLFKIAFGVAPLFDFTERATDTKYDFLIHVPIAAHFDFLPWLGSYLQVAPNISFISEFKLDITFGIGVQGRFP
jgi:hypothetical protein